MIVYVPKWLEYSYLFTIEKKEIFYGDYEPSLFDDQDTCYIIKEPKNITKYENIITNLNIIVIINSPNIKIKNVVYINAVDIIKQIGEYFNYPYSNKITQYCEKNEICPFLFIYKLSIGDKWPKKVIKIVPMVSTMSTLKYLQAGLWYYFLGKRYHKVFGNYSTEKVYDLALSFLYLEKTFCFVSDEIPQVFIYPIYKFYIKDNP